MRFINSLCSKFLFKFIIVLYCMLGLYKLTCFFFARIYLILLVLILFLILQRMPSSHFQSSSVTKLTSFATTTLPSQNMGKSPTISDVPSPPQKSGKTQGYGRWTSDTKNDAPYASVGPLPQCQPSLEEFDFDPLLQELFANVQQ